MPNRYTQSFIQGSYYHVYNRAVNNEKLFYSHENYLYFLKLYKEKVSSEVNTLAYCLLKNHFHFLVEVPEMADPSNVSKGFSRLFQSYSQAINKQVDRYGSLFCRPFKRKRIETNAYLSRVITYIHQNPQLHGVIDDFKQYQWSSYKSHISTNETLLDRTKVLSWFGGVDHFIEFHQSILRLKDRDFD